MKKLYTFYFLLVVFGLNGQTEWTGSMITITKADFADWTLEANQDRITPSVWLTRADSRGLFNIVTEAEFDNNNYTSPLDTEWANGTIADGVGTLTFETWDDSNGQNNPTIGQNKVLHLITDDIYIDFVVTAWTQGAGGGVAPGGGFSYMRSTDPNLSTENFELGEDLKLFPNPSNESIQISGLKTTQEFQIYNILGAQVNSGTISNNDKIDIRDLNDGMFFLKLDNGDILKFIKQ